MTRVADDLSIYLVCGRVTAKPEPGLTHVGRALDDAVAAERLGFRRVWLSERFDLKDAGALLAGAAARTTRLGIGTGALASSSRHPLLAASFGATMHALYGPRFVLGLGRGVPLFDMAELKIAELLEYARTVRSLWRGECVKWHSPGRSPVELKTIDVLGDIPEPEIWYCTYGLPKAAKAAVDPVFDGVMLYPFLTVEAVGAAVARIRRACEESGRDPSSLHICHPTVVAAELDDLTTRAYAHARAVTYLQWPGHGEALTRANGWDQSPLRPLREHRQFHAMDQPTADQSFHRAQLMEPASFIPDDWMEESCALGTVEHCVSRLREYREAGADEIAVYASTPDENARLIQAWLDEGATGRPRTAAPEWPHLHDSGVMPTTAGPVGP